MPKTLAAHPASIEYGKARRAAVVDWYKAYKSKGRDLPTDALENERKFQQDLRDINDPSQNSSNDNSTTSSAINHSGPKAAEPKNSLTKRASGRELKIDEKKLEESTVKGVATLINEIDKYRSTELSGDTTLVRNSAKRAASEAVARFVANQPDFYFTYPITDVSYLKNDPSGRKPSLVFSVNEPVEFEQIRRELGADLELINHSKSIRVDNAAILKISESIKPGDLLRVRFHVSFHSFGVFQYPTEGVRFAVSHSSEPGDPSLGTGNSIFIEKTIDGFQLLKQQTQTATSP